MLIFSSGCFICYTIVILHLVLNTFLSYFVEIRIYNATKVIIYLYKKSKEICDFFHILDPEIIVLM